MCNLIQEYHITPSSSVRKRRQIQSAETCVIGKVPQGWNHFSGSPLYLLNRLLVQCVVGPPDWVSIF